VINNRINTYMKNCDDIIKFIMFRKILKLSDLKSIKENDLAYLNLKLSAKKVRFEVDVITTPSILSEQEVKQFIEKTNPYISKEREIRKYTKKANILFLIKEKLSEIYDQMIKPSYYLVFDENKNDFVKAEEIPEWYRNQHLEDYDQSIGDNKPIVCWNEKDAQKTLEFMAEPYVKMGIKHSFSVKVFNSENECLEQD